MDVDSNGNDNLASKVSRTAMSLENNDHGLMMIKLLVLVGSDDVLSLFRDVLYKDYI